MVAGTEQDCQWWLTDGVTYLTLDNAPHSTAQAAKSDFAMQKTRETNAQYSTSTRPEPGIGDDAFSAFYSNYRAGFGLEQVIFVRGTYVVTIKLVARGGDSVLRPRAETLARAAAAKV
jgi:hypothetical protein